MAFDGTAIKSIFIPSTIEAIGDYAFGFVYNEKDFRYYPSEGFSAACVKNSYGEKYCIEKNITYTLTDEQNKILGDIDGDAVVSIMDTTEIQMHIAQLTVIDQDRIICADTDKDGSISIMDATRIQLFIAQLIPEL